MQGLMMDYPLTLDRIVEHAGRLFPRNRIRSKLPDGGMHEYTYADLLCRSRRLAAALVGLGVEPGDRVGTFAWNHYQHVEMYFGIPGAGAVCSGGAAGGGGRHAEMCDLVVFDQLPEAVWSRPVGRAFGHQQAATGETGCHGGQGAHHPAEITEPEETIIGPEIQHQIKVQCHLG